MNYDMYFINEGAKFIFALIHTDKDIRMNLLGITKSHYLNSNTANLWKSYVENAIFCTNFSNNLKMMALEKLNELYKNMINS